MADDYLRARDLRPHVRFALDGIDSITKLVSEGWAVALLPDGPPRARPRRSGAGRCQAPARRAASARSGRARAYVQN